MLINYLATESFWNSALFIGGVWFGVLRAYTIYQFNRSLLVLITLTTLGLPFAFYLLVHLAGLSAFASFQTKYAALLGFSISTLFAEFTMMFFVPRTIRSRSQSRTRQPSTASAELPITSHAATAPPPAPPAPSIRLKPVEPQPLQPLPSLQIKPVVAPQVIQPKVRIETPAPAPVLHSKPEPVHKPEVAHKPEPIRKPEVAHKPEPMRKPEVAHKPEPIRKPEVAHKPEPIRKPEVAHKPEPIRKPEVAHKPEPIRKPVTPRKPEPVSDLEPVTRVAANTREDSDTGFHVGNWRLFVYFFVFLIIVLFPPYYETVTNNRTWLFITSTSSRPFFSFDLTFLIYEAILLSIIVSVFEFFQSQN